MGLTTSIHFIILSTQAGFAIVLTWPQGLFQAPIVGPVLRVYLLKSPVDLRSLLRPLQLQQQLSYTSTFSHMHKISLQFRKLSGLKVWHFYISVFSSWTIWYKTFSSIWDFLDCHETKQLHSKKLQLVAFYTGTEPKFYISEFYRESFGNGPAVISLQQHYYGSHLPTMLCLWQAHNSYTNPV